MKKLKHEDFGNLNNITDNSTKNVWTLIKLIVIGTVGLDYMYREISLIKIENISPIVIMSLCTSFITTIMILKLYGKEKLSNILYNYIKYSLLILVIVSIFMIVISQVEPNESMSQKHFSYSLFYQLFGFILISFSSVFFAFHLCFCSLWTIIFEIFKKLKYLDIYKKNQNKSQRIFYYKLMVWFFVTTIPLVSLTINNDKISKSNIISNAILIYFR